MGKDPASIEGEEPRAEFSPMGLVMGFVYGRRILPVSKKSRRRNLSHGQHENADFVGVNTQVFIRRAQDPGRSRRLARLPTSKFNKLEARKIKQREGLQLIATGLQCAHRIVDIVFSRFTRKRKAQSALGTFGRKPHRNKHVRRLAFMA